MKGIMVEADELYKEAVAEQQSSSPENQADHHDDHDHDHHDHDHGNHDGHNDSDLPTQLTLYFSSLPKFIKIQQGDNVLVEQSSLTSQTYSNAVLTSLEGHMAELLVEVTWMTPSEQNFVEIELAPENHEQKTTYLRSDGDIQDIAIFEW